jgi:hypothetical protein
MRDFRLSFPACIIAGKTRLDEHDVVLLKTYSLPDGVRDWRDAMTLLVLNACCPQKCVEWQSYFIESMTFYIVEIREPKNGFDQNKLQWLTDMFTTDGLANSPIESRLLQHVMDMLAQPLYLQQKSTRETQPQDEATLAVSALRAMTQQLAASPASGHH